MTVIPFAPIQKPRESQLRGSDMIVRNGATYLMWDMGNGKTLACILALRKLGIPVLVLAPLNAAAITWPDELTKWAPDVTYTLLHGKNKKHLASRAHTFDVTIINYDGLKWFYEMVREKVFKLRKFFVIMDESSMFKDHTTKRWEILAEAYPIYSPYRVELSGTPMPHSMIDLWAQYFILDNGERLQSDFYQYRSRYFNYSGKPRYITTLKHGAEERIYDKIADITDRLGPEDQVELPDVVHNDIYMELTPKLRKLYNELEDEFLLEFPEGDVVARSSAVLSSKLRQFSQGALYLERDPGVPRGTPKQYELIHDIKVKALKGMVDTASGKPVLAPIQFRFEKAMIDKVMRYDVPIINGSTSPTDAVRLVREWNAGSIPLLLAHPRSIAFSLNLQFGGNTITWVAQPWEQDLYEQLIRRLRRPGQEASHVMVHRFMFKDTVDMDIAATLKHRDANQNRLFEGIKKRVLLRRKYKGK